MKKFEFQLKAQDDIIEKASKLLSLNRRTSLVFKAPTGSGKTVMMANALSGLVKKVEGTHELVILWVAPNTLHKQSYARLKDVYEATKALDCILFEELSGNELPSKSVLFVNWASIDSDKLVLRRENETRRNLEAFIASARVARRKIILVADESHMHLDSGLQAKIVVDHIIKPDLVIEVSATPDTENPDDMVPVEREHVVEAGLIRKSVLFNPGLTGTLTAAGAVVPYSGTSESLLDLALEKQEQLSALYREEGSPVRPLVLVQLPSRSVDAEALDRFEGHLLMRHSISRGAGLEVWLSGDQTEGLADIAAISSTVRVLFFKQAIATGWDCPRAQIMVGLRELKSETFTSQTLGRILRQPESKHYENESLNHGYVFTNYERLEVAGDAALWTSKVLVSAKKPFQLSLPNWHEKSRDERGYLTMDAVKYILAQASVVQDCRHQGPVTIHMVGDEEIVDLDKAQTIEGTRQVELDLQGLQERMNRLKAELSSNLASQKGGRKYIEKALRDAAAELLDTDEEKLVLETILHSKNKELFKYMASTGIEQFLAAQVRSGRSLEERNTWEAPAVRFIPLSTPADSYEKCFYSPVLSGQFEGSDVEEPFSRLLDEDESVETWFKNGDTGKEHFAIPYTLNDKSRLFFPDFIVKLVGGGIRFYDTKGGGTSELSTGNMADTVEKAKALHAYCNSVSNNSFVVSGAIVIRRKGVWWMHSGKDYPGTQELTEAQGWVPLKIS